MVDLMADPAWAILLQEHRELAGFSSIAGLQYLGQVDPRLAERAFHNLSHNRGIVNDQSTYRHDVALTLHWKMTGYSPFVAIVVGYIGRCQSDFRELNQAATSSKFGQDVASPCEFCDRFKSPQEGSHESGSSA